MRKIASLAIAGLVLLDCAVSLAGILNNNTRLIRIRLGDNAVGGVNTVVYQAGIPNEFAGVPGVTANPNTVSTTGIVGGSGVFRVRIITDTNLRAPLTNGPNPATQLSGEFTYDSSAPMTCITPASCGGQTIGMSKISWTTRDGDTHTTPLQYDETANQPIQTQIDTNPRTNRQGTRHRNFFRFQYDNDILLPAGTYEGEIKIDGVGVAQ